MKDAANPFAYYYEPKVDVYEPLNPDMASYDQSLIGFIKWVVELGHISIAMEVSILLSHNAYPRK